VRSATSAFGTASTGASRTNKDLEALRGLLLAQRSRGSFTETPTSRASSFLVCLRKLASLNAFLHANPQTTSSGPLPEHEKNEAAPHANREPLWRAANRRPKDGYNRTDDEGKTTMMRRP